MMKTITYRLVDLFGAEIRSRTNIENIRKELNNGECYLFDMDGITFISRGVADELCDMEENMNLKLQNMSEAVSNMHDVVSLSRKSVRAEIKTEPNIHKCETMEDLNRVFSSF